MTIGPEYIGVWRITEMSGWEQHDVDLVAPGHLTVERDGTGQFAFCAFDSGIDCRMAEGSDRQRLGFSFVGWDEGDEVSGRGWAVVDGNQMEGWFGFHLGEESTFKAERWAR